MSAGVRAPEMSCRSASQLCLCFETLYGRPRLEEVYAPFGREVPLGDLLDPKNFVSFDFAMRLLDALTEASGDPDFPSKAGSFVVSPKALGFLYHMLRSLGTPRSAYSMLVSLGPTYNKVGTFTVERLEAGRLSLRYHSDRPEPNRRACLVRTAQFANIPRIWGLAPAKLVETQCQATGADSCAYELTWAVPRRPIASALVGGVVGAAAGALFGPHALALGFAASTTLGSALGLSGGLALGFFGVASVREQLLHAQDEGLKLSMADLQARYEEIRALNEGLEQRVGERTRELSVATSKLQAALDKQLELDKLKTQFFENVSHELRTPLTLIMGPIDSLLADGLVGTSERSQLEVMRSSSLRLLAMVNSLLDLARYDAGGMRLNLDDADPAAVVASLVESAQGLGSQLGVTLAYEGPKSLAKVPLDLDKFERAVLNLISNGLKFSANVEGRRPTVTVSAAVEGARLVVRVTDNGIGIPERELPNLFTRFHQVDGTDQRAYGGAGIGLALVKEIVEFHGGTVEATSTLGTGSTFSLHVPVERAAHRPERLDRRKSRADVAVDRRQEEEREKLSQLITNPADLVLADLRRPELPVVEERPPDPSRPRVLVCDDNRDMLQYLSTILAREYDVITASDGEQGWQLAQTRLPQVIVSDVMMPRKSGFNLVKDLKRHPLTKSIPIVLVTAKADIHQKVQGIEYGADDYLTKPFNFLELRARLKQLLKTRALERSLAEKNEYLAKLNFDLVLSKKEVFLQTIEAMAFAVEAKDVYTHGHSRRVSLLSTELARRLDLTELEIERVQISAVLHDVGKLGIPEHILRKEGSLTPEEEEVIRQHPEIGYRILESVAELASINRCILMHHEKFDGTGYPHGRGSQDIPLESRIIAVADTYDAMTSDRPYRRGLGHVRAIQELRDFAGSQFDPEVVRGFLELYEERAPVFPAFPSLFGKRVG